MKGINGYNKPHALAKLNAPTPAQITAVTDVLEHRWSSNALMVQDRYTQSIERDDHNAAAKWALAGAISTDKILVLKGRPTDIVGHLHAHRHDIGQVMDKLASALRPRVEPVTHPSLTASTTDLSVVDSHLPGYDAARRGHDVS